MTHNRQVVLVTGASTGLGLAIAKRLLALSHQVILTARASSMERFAAANIFESETVWLRPLDVTSSAEREQVIEEAEAKLGGVTHLINNAGVSYRSVIEHVTEDENRAQLEVNYLAPIALSRLVLPSMRAKRSGRIIQISSAGGLMAMPTMGAYAASKFALEAATEALFYEVRPFGIAVSLVLPGFVNSEGFSKVVLTGEARRAMSETDDPYHPHYANMSGFIARLMRRVPATPDSVAKAVLRTMKRRRPPLRVPATIDTHLLWWFRRFAPHRLHHAMLYRLLPGIGSWGGTAPPSAQLRE